MKIVKALIKTIFLLAMLLGMFLAINKRLNDAACARCAVWSEGPCELLECH